MHIHLHLKILVPGMDTRKHSRLNAYSIRTENDYVDEDEMRLIPMRRKDALKQSSIAGRETNCLFLFAITTQNRRRTYISTTPHPQPDILP